MILREIKNIFIKNRLTEGVDFLRKEWLKGDGTAYIDTKVTNLSISDYIKTIFDDSGNIGVKIRTWGREENRVVVGNNKSTTSITVWGASSSFVYSNSGVYLYDMYFDLLNNKVIINNQTYNLSLPKGNGASFLLFAIRNSSNAVDYKNLAKYKSFEVHNQINLVPCQLLHAIPATLDANNRARQAGECGMYDSVSGKFYGNVANSGTFTVEGEVEPETHTGLQQIYQNKLIEGVDYETYDWLKGDGSAYINTNIKPSENLRTKTKAAYTSSSDSISRNSAIFGSSLVKSGTVSNRYWVNYDGKFEIGYGGYYSTQYSINPNQDIEIDFNYIEDNAHKFKINNSVYTQSGEPNTTRNIVIFGRNVNGSVYVRSCRVSYFQLINSSNLIMDLVPCQLIRSIPRNLDAQCKERVAGECGMIDLISGKFYGNVANSGTFTVENDNNE